MFTMTCSENNTIVHSYAENMVAHQLVRGLEDITQQEEVLALAATDGNHTLKKISEYVEVQETGLRSSKVLGGGAGVQKLNPDNKRSKSNTLPSQTPSSKERCDWCGKSGHVQTPNYETRKERCLDFDKSNDVKSVKLLEVLAENVRINLESLKAQATLWAMKMKVKLV